MIPYLFGFYENLNAGMVYSYPEENPTLNNNPIAPHLINFYQELYQPIIYSYESAPVPSPVSSENNYIMGSIMIGEY